MKPARRRTPPTCSGVRVLIALAARRSPGFGKGPLRRRGPLKTRRFRSKALTTFRAGAPDDATIVTRLRRAGAVIVGKTNMTEFAFSGLGINPHYGTPRAPYDRATGRIPGGSSSGRPCSRKRRHGRRGRRHGYRRLDSYSLSALRLDRLQADGALACRLRVPIRFRLPSIQSVRSRTALADCAIVDAILAGETPPERRQPRAVRGLRLLAPVNHVREALDDTVAGAFRGRA